MHLFVAFDKIAMALYAPVYKVHQGPRSIGDRISIVFFVLENKAHGKIPTHKLYPRYHSGASIGDP